MLLLDIISCRPVMDNRLPECDGFFAVSTAGFPLRGLTFSKKCAKFLLRKALTKTCAPVRFSERMPLSVKGTRTPATGDTTSEPRWRKCHAGCARYRVNEWLRESGATRVEPWNTECIPPLIFQGMGYFFTLPKKDTR